MLGFDAEGKLALGQFTSGGTNAHILLAIKAAYAISGKTAVIGKILHLATAAGVYAILGFLSSRFPTLHASIGTYGVLGSLLILTHKVSTIAVFGPFIRTIDFTLSQIRSAPPTLDD